jgi:hypothetical protein
MSCRSSNTDNDQVMLEVDCHGLKSLIEDRTGLRSSIGGFCFDIIEVGRSFVDFRVKWVLGMPTQWPIIVQAWCRPWSTPSFGLTIS